MTNINIDDLHLPKETLIHSTDDIIRWLKQEFKIITCKVNEHVLLIQNSLSDLQEKQLKELL